MEGVEIGKSYSEDKLEELRIKYNTGTYRYGSRENGVFYIKMMEYDFEAPSLYDDFICIRTPFDELEVIPEGPAVHRPSKRTTKAYYQRYSDKTGGKEKFTPTTETGGQGRGKSDNGRSS